MAKPTPRNPEVTAFILDVLGRYMCNGLDEAKRSTDTAGKRPDGRSQADPRQVDVDTSGVEF